MTAIDIVLPEFEPDKGEPLEPPPPPPPEPELPPPRRRRAKAKAKDEPPPLPETPVQISDDDRRALGGLLTSTAGIVFELIAASGRGDHWRLSREEAERIGNAWADPLAPLLAKHSAYVPWAVALLATSAVVIPRLQQDADKLAKAEDAQTA